MIPANATLHVTALSTLKVVLNNHNISMTLSSTANLLLVYLLSTEQPHAREAVAELFWPERQPKQAASNLRTLLSALRKSCGDHVVITRTTVGVEPTHVAYDVADFQAHITAAERGAK